MKEMPPCTCRGAKAPVTLAPVILVVDDEEQILHLMEITLRRQGFQVFTAASGRDAVEAIERIRGKVNMVLLDVRMPGLDGPDTLAALRRVMPGVRCCFMSGELGHRTSEELLRLGAERVFNKPFPMNETAQELWRLAHLEP